MPDFLALGTEQQKIRLVDVGPTALISPLCKPSVQPTEKKLRRPSKNKTQHDSVDVTVESWETPIGEQRCKLPHDIQNFHEIQQNIIHIQIFETFSLPFLPSPNPLYLSLCQNELRRSWTTLEHELGRCPTDLLFWDPSKWCHESWSLTEKKAWLKATNLGETAGWKKQQNRSIKRAIHHQTSIGWTVVP